MPNSLLQKCAEIIYKHYKEDTAKMLVITGTLGWGLSSAAQTFAVAVNPKISKEQKNFLIPQTILDAIVNIGTFFMITLAAKKMVSKLCTTGKFAPQTVRNFLNNNKELYGDKVGKLSLNLDEVMKQAPKHVEKSYNTYKNYATTLGTVGASVLATNIVTPIIRNSGASNIQKYINNNPRPNSGMKV